MWGFAGLWIFALLPEKRHTHISMSCESKLNLRHFPVASSLHCQFRPTAEERLVWLWWMEISAVPPQCLAQSGSGKTDGKTAAGEELGKLLSSPSTCVVPVLEPEKRRDYFSSRRALEGSDDRHTESRTDGCTATAVDGGWSEIHANSCDCRQLCRDALVNTNAADDNAGKRGGWLSHVEQE